ncbi:oligosaccharide flippase family protein [Mycoplasmatota bacterium WC44]
MYKKTKTKLLDLFNNNNDEKLKKIAKNVMILFFGDFTASVFGILSMVITVKILGLEEYGWLVLVQTYVFIIDSLMNFQSWTALIKYGAGALNNKDKKLFENYIVHGFILDICTAILGTIVAFTASDLIGKLLNWDETIIMAVKIYSFSIFSHISGTPIGILRLLGKYKLFTFHKMGISIIKFVILSISLFTGVDFYSILIISLFIDILSNLILLMISIYVLYKNGIRAFNLRAFKLNYKFIKFSILNNLTTSIDIPVKQMDVFIISTVLSFELISVYKIFKNITNIFSRVANQIYQVVFPELALFIAKREYKNAIKITIKITSLILIVGIPITILVSATSKWWLLIIFDETVSSYWVTFSLLLTIRMISSALIAIHPLFIALGYVKQNLYIVGFANVIYLFSAWFLGINFGLNGLAIAFGLQLIIVIYLKVVRIRRFSKK